MKFLLAYITTKNKKEAEKIGQALVKEKLAACVNIIPKISSIYWWQSKIKRADEAFLIVKTKNSLKEQVVRKVRSLHSYECPEIIFLPIVGGSKEYLRWWGESLK